MRTPRSTPVPHAPVGRPFQGWRAWPGGVGRSSFRSLIRRWGLAGLLMLLALLSACGGGGAGTQTPQAAPPPPRPAIAAFAADPATIAPGGSSQLTATFSGGIASIDHGVGTVTSGVVVSTGALSVSTTYTLTVTNAAGDAITATTSVAVGPAVAITSFTSAKAILTAGTSTTLTPIFVNATSASIDHGVGAVSSGTPITVSPSSTTTYTLTVNGLGGPATQALTITVVPAPAITAFAANPASIVSGASSQLTATFSGGTASIDHGVGAVTSGLPVTISPASTTTYTLTVTNAAGDSVSATATLTVGPGVALTAFTAAKSIISAGSGTTLLATFANATSASIDHGVGTISSGVPIPVSPAATTTYTLTLNGLGGPLTQSLTITVVPPPVITAFAANPASIVSGGSSQLTATFSGGTASIDHGVGTVTSGLSVTVGPASTTTYTLTVTNAAGDSVSATATLTVTPPSPPIIASFTASPTTLRTGQSSTLSWSVSGATSLSIDQGVGQVAGTSTSVSPNATTTYTLTATNAGGTATASLTIVLTLVQITSSLYNTEHCLFIIPDPATVNTNDYNSVFLKANTDAYVATLKAYFPSDYALVVVTVNRNFTAVNGSNPTPNMITYRKMADGLGMNAVVGVGVPDICRYNMGGSTIITPTYAVLDHEIGHCWGVFIGAEVGAGHWLSNGTATGQMANVYSDDGYLTVKQIVGDPVSGFHWVQVNNLSRNDTETFDDHDLYLQGLHPTFPDDYVLSNPVYNADTTLSYSAVTKYDHAWCVAKNGPRVPDYTTSEKRHRVGFVFIAQDFAEVLSAYQAVEQSASHFTNAEAVDTVKFRFQVPYLVETKFRASVDTLLADLDGNATPSISIPGPTYVVASGGSATVPFTTSDPGDAAPSVSCIGPLAPYCAISGGNAVLTGLPTGSYFFTLRAQDSKGKKGFAHFVVDVP